jgi:hypothetical protein
MKKDTTLVVFRRWRDSGGIIALFPEIPSDIKGYFCEAFEHIGQHGGADYHGVVRVTRPATDEEAAPLAEELRLLGYNLQPIHRASQAVHECRMATARAIKATTV